MKVRVRVILEYDNAVSVGQAATAADNGLTSAKYSYLSGVDRIIITSAREVEVKTP